MISLSTALREKGKARPAPRGRGRGGGRASGRSRPADPSLSGTAPATLSQPSPAGPRPGPPTATTPAAAAGNLSGDPPGAAWRSEPGPPGGHSQGREEHLRFPFNFPQQPQQNHMTRLRQSPWCVRCYFGRKSEWLLYKFHLMPARPSVSEAAAPSLPAKPRSPGRGRGDLINLQNACDLLIYYYNRSSAHDTFPALGASTTRFQQFLASAPDRLQGL